jgi:hypothetical protein
MKFIAIVSKKLVLVSCINNRIVLVFVVKVNATSISSIKGYKIGPFARVVASASASVKG